MTTSNAPLRHTMVGLRALNGGTQATPTKVAKKGATESAKLDRVVRGDEEDRRRPVFERAPEDEEAEALAPPPGHNDASRRIPGEAFRRDAKGKPIPPCYGDVDQGNLANAWLLASFAAVAHRAPQLLVRSIRRRSEHDFAVDVAGDTIIVTPDISLEGYADPTPNGQSDTLWVALLEKAFAIREGGSYAHLETGNAGRALEAITGKRSKRISVSEHVDLARLSARLIEHKSAPMVVKTRGGNLTEPLVGDHNYAVLEVTSEALKLFNPWGSGGGSRPIESMVHVVPIAELVRELESITVALI